MEEIIELLKAAIKKELGEKTNGYQTRVHELILCLTPLLDRIREAKA